MSIESKITVHVSEVHLGHDIHENVLHWCNWILRAWTDCTLLTLDLIHEHDNRLTLHGNPDLFLSTGCFFQLFSNFIIIVLTYYWCRWNVAPVHLFLYSLSCVVVGSKAMHALLLLSVILDQSKFLPIQYWYLCTMVSLKLELFRVYAGE